MQRGGRLLIAAQFEYFFGGENRREKKSRPLIGPMFSQWNFVANVNDFFQKVASLE